MDGADGGGRHRAVDVVAELLSELLSVGQDSSTSPDEDALSPGDTWVQRPPEPPPFSERPIRPDPPRREP